MSETIHQVPDVPDVPDTSHIDALRACARMRACSAYKGEPGTSGTPGTGFIALPTAPVAAPAILALDLGTMTGWSLASAEGIITSGTASFKSSRYDGGGMRFLRFRSWLDEVLQYAGHIHAVHFEEVRRHMGVDASHVYGGFLATLTAWCEHRAIAYQGVPVATIKRFIAGRGNADKSAVIAAVQARGFHPADDNEADAIAILLWAIRTKGGVR